MLTDFQICISAATCCKSFCLAHFYLQISYMHIASPSYTEKCFSLSLSLVFVLVGFTLLPRNAFLNWFSHLPWNSASGFCSILRFLRFFTWVPCLRLIHTSTNPGYATVTSVSEIFFLIVLSWGCTLKFNLNRLLPICRWRKLKKQCVSSRRNIVSNQVRW